MFDVVFISYQEENAEQNFFRVQTKNPNTLRVSEVEGIHNAFKHAANLSKKKWIFIIDGDNFIDDAFCFNNAFNVINKKKANTYVWSTLNPVNGLIYGNGGIKLMNRKLMINELSEIEKTEYSNSVHRAYSVIDFPIAKPIFFTNKIGSVNNYNFSPLSAWRAAFRECFKLTYFSTYDSNYSVKKIKLKLSIWKTAHPNVSNGYWSIRGAIDGENHAINLLNKGGNPKSINDFQFLSLLFTNKYKRQ